MSACKQKIIVKWNKKSVRRTKNKPYLVISPGCIKVSVWTFQLTLTHTHTHTHTHIYIYIYIYTGVGKNNGNTWKFQKNLFWYGFLITALPWNPALRSTLLTVFEETEFLKWSLISAVIFGAVFLWSFLTIPVRVWQSLSNSFRFFFSEFCLSEKIFPPFWNAVTTFQTVLLTTRNNSAVLRAPTIWSLLKFDWSAILMNFDSFLLMISAKNFFVKKDDKN